MELILTTPLASGEIVEGQIAATRAQFRPVRWTLFGICVAMMTGGLWMRSWTAAAIIEYGLIWGLLLAWPFCGLRQRTVRAIWKVLNTGRPVSAVFKVRGNRWIWLCYYLFYGRMIFNAFSGKAVSFPTGSPWEVAVVSVVSFCALMIMVAITIQEKDPDLLNKLIRELRVIAQEPVPEANDPRLKSWDGRNRLPAARPASVTYRIS